LWHHPQAKQGMEATLFIKQLDDYLQQLSVGEKMDAWVYAGHKLDKLSIYQFDKQGESCQLAPNIRENGLPYLNIYGDISEGSAETFFKIDPNALPSQGEEITLSENYRMNVKGKSRRRHCQLFQVSAKLQRDPGFPAQVGCHPHRDPKAVLPTGSGCFSPQTNPLKRTK
jgi:hypothetical protein